LCGFSSLKSSFQSYGVGSGQKVVVDFVVVVVGVVVVVVGVVVVVVGVVVVVVVVVVGVVVVVVVVVVVGRGMTFNQASTCLIPK
jgi:hypothetical protein